MHFNLAQLSDEVLVRDLAALVDQDRSTTASLLAHIAEVDTRRLYAPAGYSSMFAYCVEELRLSEDSAAKRIQAARAARRFPTLFGAVEDGRIHLAGVCLLAPHLTPDNADDLIAAAFHRKKSEIELLLAGRFPTPDAPAVVRLLSVGHELHAPGYVGTDPQPIKFEVHAPGHVAGGENAQEESKRQGYSADSAVRDEHAPGHADGSSQERYLLQVTISKSTHDKLRYVQALLSHAVSKGNVAEVLDRSLDALIAQAEKRKFAAPSSNPRSVLAQQRRSSTQRPRYIPAPVRRTVWERDSGQCTFVSAKGKRCAAHQFLEFDHVEPVARGGKATVEGLRLRCRAHNQFEAERSFGVEFMSRKRVEARMVAEKRRAARLAMERARGRAAAQEQSRDVQAGLRSLGCRADEARRAAEFTETLQGATLEGRMRAALEFLGSRSKRGHVVPAATG
jgi:5-methylcytosine-specific restriction endonuclease McrA